ncbi:MAG: glycosyltransferase [Bryobacteraceae bacterium]
MTFVPRVALFADCFHETNGVANTMRRLESYARANGLPMLCVRHADQPGLHRAGTVTAVELRRSPLRIPIDMDFGFDLLVSRHLRGLIQRLRDFGADVVHITGPGDCSALGLFAARALGVPLVASWHTNIHEFGARRLARALPWLPERLRSRAISAPERAMLRLLLLYYRIPRLILAPNVELVSLLSERTGRPVRLMSRGVDTALYSPERRRRTSGELVFGYVGRLTPEKNVGLLLRVARALELARAREYRFVIVGDGGERRALERAMPQAEFPGVLKGELLAGAYASMDVLLFPSCTDTFGNVVLEAQASGVPALVTGAGGPKFSVTGGSTGWIAESDADFVSKAVEIAAARQNLPAMRAACRDAALERRWDIVFARLYDAYRSVVEMPGARRAEAVADAG